MDIPPPKGKNSRLCGCRRKLDRGSSGRVGSAETGSAPLPITASEHANYPAAGTALESLGWEFKGTTPTFLN